MITYNQYHQLCVRQRLLVVTCLSWRDFLRKQDLFHYADAASLPYWCHYRHLGPPIIHWLHLFVWFCCFITFLLSSCFSASSSSYPFKDSFFLFTHDVHLSVSFFKSLSFFYLLSFRNWQNIFNLSHISTYENLCWRDNIVWLVQMPETCLLVIY